MAYTDIDKPDLYFNTVTYTGNATARSITGVGFQPDFVWIKNREATEDHTIYDALRGAEIRLGSNYTDGDDDRGSFGLTAFGSDGFTIGTGGELNGNNQGIVSWNWKANGSGSSNTDGSITSTVSASTTSGFSIVSYTGTGANATVGHGLGVAPSVIFFKNRTDVENWVTYHKPLFQNSFLKLNTADASASNSAFMNSTSPTSSVFSLGTFNNNNGSGDSQIAYCFAEKKGFSKFGSYTGNNSNDGNFVYLGFKPAWILFKATDSGQYWHLIDSVREPFNDDDASQLSPNNSGSESTIKTDRGTAKVDFLSNGFKLRSSGSSFNGTNSMIYMAFAESPFVTSTGIPTTAR